MSLTDVTSHVPDQLQGDYLLPTPALVTSPALNMTSSVWLKILFDNFLDGRPQISKTFLPDAKGNKAIYFMYRYVNRRTFRRH